MLTMSLPRRVAARLFVFVALALLQTAVWAVQPALRDYQARMDTFKAQIPAITASAQQAAEAMLAHPEALLNVPFWEQMGFSDELMNRAGGLAHAYPSTSWGRVPTEHDVVLLSVRSWETQSALMRRRVKEYKAQGWTVTVIASAVGKPADLGADYFIDNGAPSAAAVHGRINALANVTLGWMWCCEYGAAMSRKGKFPAILYSICMPGSREHNAKYQSPDGRRAVVDCPTAVPAGELAEKYLARVNKLVADLQSPKTQEELRTAADVIAKRLEDGRRVGIAGLGHVVTMEVMVDNKSPLLGFRAAFAPDYAFRLHLRPGDLLVWMAYAGMNSMYDDYAKGIAASKVELITSYNPDPEQTKDPPPTLAHIDHSWQLPDAEVPIPVFPNAMAPVSGLNVTLLARMLDDEVAARRVGKPAPPVPPISPELCDIAGKNYYPKGSQYASPPPVRKWGYLNAKGAQIIARTYDTAGAFSGGVAVVGRDGKVGLIDTTGKVILPLQYDEIIEPWGMTNAPFLFAREGKNWGVIERTGKVLTAPRYPRLYSFSQKYVTVRQDGKFRLMTLTGDEVPGAVYNQLWGSTRGYAWVNIDDKWGLLDDECKVLIPAKYTDINNFADGVAMVQSEGKWGCVNTEGKELAPFKYDRARDFIDGVVPVRLGEKWGALATSGQEVIPPQYDEVKESVEGLLAVKLNDKWGYLDTTGAIVIPIRYDAIGAFANGVTVATRDGKQFLLEKTGKETALKGYDYVADAGEGFFKVARNGKWGFIDKTGKEVVTPKYSYVLSFSQGKALVARGGAWSETVAKCAVLVGEKWGMVDSKGREVIPPKYDCLLPANDGPTAVGDNLEVMFAQP